MSKELEKLRYTQGIEMFVPKTEQKKREIGKFKPRDVSVLTIILVAKGAQKDVLLGILQEGSAEIQDLGAYFIDENTELKNCTKEQAEEARRLLLSDKIL
jgi:hypothetical protein